MSTAAQGRLMGIDIGGTSIRVATATTDDPATFEPIVSGPVPPDLDSFRQLVSDTVQDVTETGPLVGVGVGVPGLVEGTSCAWVPHLPYLDGVDLAPLIGADLAGRLAVGNDAQFSLLAEAAFGRASSISDALLLALGTGIGSAVLVEGQIVRGQGGAACSFGWVCADLSDEGDPRHGWLERHASGRALDLAGAAQSPPMTAAELVETAAGGAETALTHLHGIGRALGITLAGAISLLAPEVVLVVGGMSTALDLMRPTLEEALAQHLPPHLRHVRVERGAMGEKAGVVGALTAGAHAPDWWEMRR